MMGVYPEWYKKFIEGEDGTMSGSTVCMDVLQYDNCDASKQS